jgi:fumarylacetoacetase
MNPATISKPLAGGNLHDMNPTNHPALRSFLPVPAESHFPIQNLPYGVFRPKGDSEPRIGVAIGELILDLGIVVEAGLLGDVPRAWEVFTASELTPLFAAGRPTWQAARAAISRLLRADEPVLRDNTHVRDRALVPMTDVEMLLPTKIGDYTDFYSSKEHASNVGRMFRGPDKALLPNWLHVPIAYHGRASSIVISGTDLHRPGGQTNRDNAASPSFGPSQAVDFELELGYFIGPGNPLGQPIPIAEAGEHIFGFVLVNDWSARDIQQWEYVPLGPFLAKNFGTSISPWVVPFEALEPFRVTGPTLDPRPLPYLQSRGDWALDIHLEVTLQGARMDRPQRLCATNARYLYWNVSQQLAHHTVNGCNLRPGDLLATGTISGPTPDSFGSLLELAWKGTKPIPFPNGEQRTYLQDGDRVTMTGWCQGQGYRVGFGEVTGRVLPALGLGEAW